MQSGKAGKIAVARAKCDAVLNGQRREVCVHHQRPPRLPVQDQFAENLPMSIGGFQNRHGRLFQPRGDRLQGLSRGQRTRQRAGIGADSHEGQNRRPCESNRLRAAEAILDPPPGYPVMGGGRIVGVKQKIGVDQNQR